MRHDTMSITYIHSEVINKLKIYFFSSCHFYIKHSTYSFPASGRHFISVLYGYPAVPGSTPEPLSNYSVHIDQYFPDFSLPLTLYTFDERNVLKL